jgi:hypothetical protein
MPCDKVVDRDTPIENHIREESTEKLGPMGAKEMCEHEKLEEYLNCIYLLAVHLSKSV